MAEENTAVASTTLFRVSPPRAKYLLVVNKGPGAVNIPRDPGKWDLLDIYFMPQQIADIRANPASIDADHVAFETSRDRRKFAIVKTIFETNPFWRHYDAIMLADDDVEPTCCTMTDIFDLFMKTGCRIGQPALTQDSFFSHMITVKNNNFIWRKTNFIEIMCPILTPAAIDDYLHLFDASVTAYGLDYYWSYHECHKGFGVAMLDQTPVKHGRPVGTGMAYEGLNEPHQQFLGFLKQHNIPQYAHLCLDGAAIKKDDYVGTLRLGLTVSGYDRKFLNNLSYVNYIAHEVVALQSRSS